MCLFAFTETWLADRDTDHDLHITGFGYPIRLDRSQEITRKSTGGGVCFYVNERYCNTVVVREKVCTPDIELLSISLRPHYLPREFPQLFFTLVYIHPRANANTASQLIADVTHRLDTISPDAPKFILGDFNHCKLKKVMKNYEQYVTCATTIKNTTLDLCFGTVPQAYKSRALPSFGVSYHNAVLLAPVYRPVCERVERVVKTVKQWTADSVECLQGCFDCTAWEVFYDACESLDELTDVVSSYISFCVDTVIPTKQTVIFPNNKPWVTKELKSVLNKKKRVFYTGSAEEKKRVNREVRGAISKAKREYKDKIEQRYSSGDLRAAWKGIKNMASVNQKCDVVKKQVKLDGVDDCDLPNVLNDFYTRFEQHDFSSDISDLRKSFNSDCDIVVSQEHVTSLFKHIDVNKAPGPDGIGGRVLRCCADQLGSVFTHLFQLSLDSGHIPALWKFSNIVPLPKKTTPKQPNDFRPVALTSVVMKTLEKIVKSLVLAATEKSLDPLQFAYRAGRGVDDAKLFILNTLYKHLEKPKAHARILFADFSSAFNTVQPHILVQRLLSDFNVAHQLVQWILDFLTNRQQRVFVNGMYSDVRTTNTGSPQGCCLSPFLYILYTDSCRCSREGSHLVKFSDDAALLTLLQGEGNSHGDSLSDFVGWCDSNFLELNVSKTKEMCIDFRKTEFDVSASMIHNEPVDIVESFKYLGTVFDNKLKWDVNTEDIVKRGQQRMYLLRKLNSFSVSSVILCRFYQSFIESLISFSFICWFRNLSVHDRNSLTGIVNLCSKITGVKQRDLESFCDKQTIRKAASILGISDHVLACEFALLKSGKRYAMPICKTNRHLKSFIPSAIQLINKM
jgi:hypothetical protein